VIRLSDRSGVAVSLERNGSPQEYGSMFHASPTIIRPELGKNENERLRMRNNYFGKEMQLLFQFN